MRKVGIRGVVGCISLLLPLLIRAQSSLPPEVAAHGFGNEPANWDAGGRQASLPMTVIELLGSDGSMRASVAVYNTPQDIDVLVSGLGRLREFFG